MEVALFSLCSLPLAPQLVLILAHKLVFVFLACSYHRMVVEALASEGLPFIPLSYCQKWAVFARSYPSSAHWDSLAAVQTAQAALAHSVHAVVVADDAAQVSSPSALVPVPAADHHP